jgi:hypothetical protein
MTIVDMLGLNDRELAHVPDERARACALVARDPDIVFAAEQLAAPLGKVLDMRVLAVFDDPAWAQVDPPHAQRSYVLEVRGVRPGWLRRCEDEGPAPTPERAHDGAQPGKQ